MYLGIDIGGTFIKYALINEKYEIIKKWKKKTVLCQTKNEFYDYLCQGLEELVFSCIGISAPGVIDEGSNVLSRASQNVCIMKGTNVNEEVNRRLHKKVATINDAKAAGYCEFKIGNGKNTQSSVYFIIGTGIGGCICNQEGVIQGKDNIAGEFSNIPMIDRNGDVHYLTEYASMTALIDIYNSMTDEPLEYGTQICEKYYQGDLIATKAIEQWCNNIVTGLFSVVIFYNPEVICLGGGISEEDWFIEKIQTMFNEYPSNFKGLISTRIERCLYNNDANILGAVLYALR